jgi:hypothetical protein
MQEELEQLEQVELRHHELLDLFEELTFREKWEKVFAGLKMPKDTGDYKFARLQMIRLSAPISAVVVPILMFGLIAVFAAMTPDPDRLVQVEIIEPEAPEELEKIEEPIIEPPDPPDPVDVDFTPDPTLPPSEVASPPVEYSPQPAEFDSVAITKSPIIMKGIYGSRSPGARGAAMARYGGSGTEGAVLRALRWLKKTQRADGSWANDKPSMTALAVLAYLAHGDTPASPEFGYTIEKAIYFLIESQQANGHFRGADGHDYTQPIVAYALCEAYGLTKVPQILEAAEKAIKIVVVGQNAHGGFNYNLKGPTDTRNDISYIAWCVQALKAAKMAYVEVDGLEAAMKKAVAGVKKNYSGKDGYGGFGYTSPGRTGLSGAGVLCLQFLGHANDRETTDSLAALEKAVFSWDKGQIDTTHKNDPIYYWYYLTQAKFQAGGATWASWNKQFSPTLMKNQNVVGKEASGYVDHEGKPQEIGSWMPPPGTNMHGGGNNPTFSTILCTLMLEVYYRYLPTFKQPEELNEQNPAKDNDDIDINIVELNRLLDPHA